LPISRQAIGRLEHLAKQLGDQDAISVLIDDPAQLAVFEGFSDSTAVRPRAYIKIDMGGKRAGVGAQSERLLQVARAALEAHQRGHITLAGLYSHAGHSYGGDSRVAALKMMGDEIQAMLEGADRVVQTAKDMGVTNLPPLVLSGGASPTALSVQNLVMHDSTSNESTHLPELKAEAQTITNIIDTVRQRGHVVEIHAGVYPTLDLQQLAAHSLSSSRLSWRDIALTVIAEVHSVYPGRGAEGSSEVLIGAGGLVLGREFCKAYDGFGILTPFCRPGVEMPKTDVEEHEGWVVGRFSQEHGIVTWGHGNKVSKTTPAAADELKYGQLVRLWPNHACITSSHFGWYFVVDTDREGKENEIVDCWVRAKGW
jgi:D-serine ammonia-lyase